MMSVGVSMDIKTSSSHISDSSSVAVEPSHLLEVVVGPVVSDNSGVAVVHPVVLSILNGDDKFSVVSRSDGSGSPVEHPPLLVVVWVVISDSESVLVSTDVLVIEESSS